MGERNLVGHHPLYETLRGCSIILNFLSAKFQPTSCCIHSLHIAHAIIVAPARALAIIITPATELRVSEVVGLSTVRF